MILNCEDIQPVLTLDDLKRYLANSCYRSKVDLSPRISKSFYDIQGSPNMSSYTLCYNCLRYWSSSNSRYLKLRSHNSFRLKSIAHPQNPHKSTHLTEVAKHNFKITPSSSTSLSPELCEAQIKTRARKSQKCAQNLGHTNMRNLCPCV